MTKSVRSIVVATSSLVALSVLAYTAWMLFGWVQFFDSAAGIVTVHRSFGRMTKITHQAKNANSPHYEARFAWDNPYAFDRLGECITSGVINVRMDRNFDGRWDSWLIDIDQERPCRATIQVDLNGDGQPDYSESIQFGAVRERLSEIDQERGFPPYLEQLDKLNGS